MTLIFKVTRNSQKGHFDFKVPWNGQKRGSFSGDFDFKVTWNRQNYQFWTFDFKVIWNGQKVIIFGWLLILKPTEIARIVNFGRPLFQSHLKSPELIVNFGQLWFQSHPKWPELSILDIWFQGDLKWPKGSFSGDFHFKVTDDCNKVIFGWPWFSK